MVSHRMFLIRGVKMFEYLKGKNLYLSQGFINWEDVLNLPFTFIVAVGCRGGGKTYGSLLYCLQHNLKVFYIRRTQKQLKMMMPDMEK